MKSGPGQTGNGGKGVHATLGGYIFLICRIGGFSAKLPAGVQHPKIGVFGARILSKFVAGLGNFGHPAPGQHC